MGTKLIIFPGFMTISLYSETCIKQTVGEVAKCIFPLIALEFYGKKYPSLHLIKYDLFHIMKV